MMVLYKAKEAIFLNEKQRYNTYNIQLLDHMRNVVEKMQK